jgi:hypothetical protein
LIFDEKQISQIAQVRSAFLDSLQNISIEEESKPAPSIQSI